MIKFENKVKQRQDEQSIADSSNEAQNCPNFELSDIDKEIIWDNENVEILTDLEVI